MIVDGGFVNAAGMRLEARWIEASALEAGGLDRAQESPVILMLHEGLGCLALWRDFPEKVAQATGAPVLVWSRPGYGRSSPVELPRPLSYMHDEARDVLPDIVRQLGGRPYILLGHSDGASIALIHAGSAADPSLAGLVLMAPHVFVEDISVEGIEAAREAWQQGGLREKLAKYHQDNVDCAFLGWNGAWLDPGFRSWNLEEFLPAITAPALLIQGRDDNYGTLAQIETIDAGMSGPAQSLVLEACGHAPQNDQTAAVLAGIAEFCETLERHNP